MASELGLDAAAEAGQADTAPEALLLPPAGWLGRRNVRRPESPRAVTGPTRTLLWMLVAALCAAAALLALVASAAPSSRRHLDTPHSRFPTEHEVKKNTCGRMEVGVDYASEDYTRKLRNVTSASQCCAACDEEETCGAWTWGMVRGNQELTNVCFMKELADGQEPSTKDSPELVSGLSSRTRSLRLGASDGAIVTADGYHSSSLYCFSLIIPGSYEIKLLRYQQRESVSIFACDGYSIYSNEQIDVDGVNTSIVDSDLKCEKGGEFGTALNLKIFLAVWTAVLRDAEFQFHGWTVKVDPDTVFFPRRLLGLLSNHHEPSGSGLYLNNCKYGLHGPMEVLSRKAVHAWAMGASDCVDHFAKVCSGDCYWGEDMFIDQCLSKVLHIRRENEFKLLTEDHCDAPPNWRWCRDRVQAAFHPFKTLEGWKGCMVNATS
mmetsp:Transcript_31749/g.83269  ORF Transcript_31749/g.83269 Transcript_31749/m.83269 type:complete len:434 (+) Transcript_31749:84-1385(+)